MITPKELTNLRTHLQTAVEVELSTIPLYLYTYYSINRQPNVSSLSKEKANKIATFANKAGGILMSVAVEEMLHLSLASNILKALGGIPMVYGKSPAKYPTNLAHHKDGFLIGLQKLSAYQLSEFMAVEKPAPTKTEAQGDQWETLGQFYEYIEKLVEKTTDKNYSNANKQLISGKGYYAPNNIDTIYPKSSTDISADNVAYPNSEEDNDLRQIKNKKDAIKAIQEISEQGEGFRVKESDHKFDDKDELEESHWYKYKELHKDIQQFTEDELKTFVYDFPDNPITTNFPPQYQLVVELNNAVYSYLLWMTEKSFTLEGSAQSSMFYIGMHKGMIFILDKLIGGMRDLNLAPSFENYMFKNIETAKEELVELAEYVSKTVPQLNLGGGILGRIKDLPDVNVVNNKISFSSKYDVTPPSNNNGCAAAAAVSQCPSKSGCGAPKSQPTSSNGCGGPSSDSSNKAVNQCPSKSGCGTPKSQPASSNGCGGSSSDSSNKAVSQCPSRSGCGTPKSHTSANNGCGATSKPTNGCGAVPPANNNGCGATPKPTNGCGGSSCGSSPEKPAVIDNPKELHVCMGLNSCKGHDRTGKNDCAGMGACATAAMHSCHTLNDCRNQGGCGLYGTSEEQSNPGNNDCSWQGSCGVPINSERFSTEGPNKGKSVWNRAREVFEKKMEKASRQYGPSPMAGGPTAEHIKKSFKGYAACGASGLSGGGSCS